MTFWSSAGRFSPPVGFAGSMQMTLQGFGDEASDLKKRDEFVAAARSSTIFAVDNSRVTDDSR